VITRIELDGFKTFQDFTLDLAPFQVIVGANGVGKSNLFDALRLLSQLADDDLHSAFQAMRGEAGELFTVRPSGEPVDTITFAVEMLVDRTVRDSWGAEENLRHTRLRYELTVTRSTDSHGLDRLYVRKEVLKPLQRGDDAWVRRQMAGERKMWLPELKRGRGKPLISTEDEDGPTPTIHLHQDGHAGRKQTMAANAERTVLSGVVNTEFPHAFAAREEMRYWRFLQLNPEVLREPGPMLAKPVIATDGDNLPAALARMTSEDAHLMSDVARDLANLVPGIVSVRIEEDRPRDRFVVKVGMQDGSEFSSRVLSDGTLRLLALVALKNDPSYSGVLCFEEPENGVHPFRIRNMVELLRGLATDFKRRPEEEPLRQLLVNTHSPVLVSELMRGHKWDEDAAGGAELLFAYMSTHIDPSSGRTLRLTRAVPVISQGRLPLGISESEASHTLDEVVRYLETAEAGQAITALRQEATQ